MSYSVNRLRVTNVTDGDRANFSSTESLCPFVVSPDLIRKFDFIEAA